jgi:hypothetical protein
MPESGMEKLSFGSSFFPCPRPGSEDNRGAVKQQRSHFSIGRRRTALDARHDRSRGCRNGRARLPFLSASQGHYATGPKQLVRVSAKLTPSYSPFACGPFDDWAPPPLPDLSPALPLECSPWPSRPRPTKPPSLPHQSDSMPAVWVVTGLQLRSFARRSQAERESAKCRRFCVASACRNSRMSSSDGLFHTPYLPNFPSSGVELTAMYI